jgi:hypothetical protein
MTPVRFPILAAVAVGAVAGVAIASPRPTKRVAKPELPPGVTMVARGVWGGAVSPDGAAFAHFTGLRSRQLAIDPVDAGGGRERRVIPLGEATCTASACMDSRCSRIEWSPDGAAVAVRTDDGLYAIDVAAASRRRVDTDDAPATCTFRFGGDGVLEYVAPGKRGEVVRRDGEPDPVLKLPPGANSHQLGDRYILTGAWEFRHYVVTWTELWVVDRARRKIRHVYQRDSIADGADPDVDDGVAPMWEPKLAPDEATICWQSDGVRCLWTKTGKTFALSRGRDRGGDTGQPVKGRRGERWGHEKTLPYSPSGKKLAFRNGDTLMVHDFATGRTTDVLAPVRHKDYAWITETQLVLYEQEDTRDRSIPAIARLDLARGDGAEEAVVSSIETQYNAPVIAPGRGDVLFIGRERPGSGARDLVRVALPAAEPADDDEGEGDED